jgi:hypothetical protein
VAAIDGSINDPTPTSHAADRVDIWQASLRLLQAAHLDPKASDVLDLAHFLAGDDF